MSARYSRLSYYPSIFSVECPLLSERKCCRRRCRCRCCCCCCRCLEAASNVATHICTSRDLFYTHVLNSSGAESTSTTMTTLPRVARQTSTKVSLTCRHNRFLTSAASLLPSSTTCPADASDDVDAERRRGLPHESKRRLSWQVHL